MADELGVATRALKHGLEGRGFVKRVTGVKGIPDFIVSFRGIPHKPIFVELKHDNTKIHPLQAVCLDELHTYGILAVLLIYRSDNKWEVHRPPFLDKHLRLRSLKTPDLVLEELTFAGLGELNVELAHRSEKSGRFDGQCRGDAEKTDSPRTNSDEQKE